MDQLEMRVVWAKRTHRFDHAQAFAASTVHGEPARLVEHDPALVLQQNGLFESNTKLRETTLDALESLGDDRALAFANPVADGVVVPVGQARVLHRELAEGQLLATLRAATMG